MISWQEKEVLLFLPKCELRPLEEGIPAYCHSYLIKAATSVPQQRRRLHWEEKPRTSLRAQRPALRGQRAGYPAAPKAQEPARTRSWMSYVVVM
eukprot:Skav228290  [mRNA]  locus=scaffold209:18635:20053:- [translate_table: standard]